jgi:CheY-like chemotaxis protein
MEHTLLPRLLLIDDEPRLLSGLCTLLGSTDYLLTTASSGTQALDHLRKFHSILIWYCWI